MDGLFDLIYFIKSNIFSVVVGIVVYLIMKSKCAKEKDEAYRQGQDDYMKEHPEEMERLKNLTERFEKAYSDYCKTPEHKEEMDRFRNISHK